MRLHKGTLKPMCMQFVFFKLIIKIEVTVIMESIHNGINLYFLKNSYLFLFFSHFPFVSLSFFFLSVSVLHSLGTSSSSLTVRVGFSTVYSLTFLSPFSFSHSFLLPTLSHILSPPLGCWYFLPCSPFSFFQ